MTPDEQSCLERFERHAAQLKELMDLIGDRPRLVGHDNTVARELYRSVKGRLRQDYRSGETNRGYEALTDAEQRWYYPTIQEAYGALHSQVTATLGQRLFGELSDVHSMIVMTIGEMKQSLGGA